MAKRKNPDLESRLQRYGEIISYVVDNKILCCAKDCKKGKWHEDYHKEHGHWFKKYDDKGNTFYPQYPEEIDKGCYNCGGGGIIANKYSCPGGCEKEIWHSPWPMTMYDGKKYRSFCGTELVYTSHGSVCEKCAEEQNGRSGNKP